MLEDKKNPWEKLERKQVYDNPWITVYEDDVINPAGNEGIYGTVAFKNLAIGIIPIDEDGNTYLVGQYRYPLEAYSWEIPMGGGPLDIDPLVSAKRELKEETGLTATSWEKIMTIHTSNSVCNEEGYVYTAKGLTEGEMQPEEVEELKVWKLPLKEAIQMAYEGKITDSLSLASLLKLGMTMYKEAKH